MDASVFIQQHWLLLLIFLATTSMIIFYQEDRSFLIAPSDVMQAVSNGACLIDVRPENMCERYIYGAQMHPYQDAVITLPLTIAKNQPIILYCGAMDHALKARRALLQKGYTKVRVIEKGMAAWIAEGLPTVEKKQGNQT